MRPLILTQQAQPKPNNEMKPKSLNNHIGTQNEAKPPHKHVHIDDEVTQLLDLIDDYTSLDKVDNHT